MHVFILGICGTFMGSLALLAKQAGHRVSGCDANVYPPMSDQLTKNGIDLKEGYDPTCLSEAKPEDQPDLVIVGNAMSRGNPLVEALLNQGIPYTSGPQWLADHVLHNRHVLAVAGTHGKTTTSTMLTWILHHQGLEPGYLIGGVPINLPASANLGGGKYFVVEADEYDSAFFDKRSKFIHYHPRTAILNNLEFDHADIFPDLAAIQTQFHYLVRTIPSEGCIISPQGDTNIEKSLAKGCWSRRETTGGTDGHATWRFRLLASDGSHFKVIHESGMTGEVKWQQTGLHNVYNGLAALAAAHDVGIELASGCQALSEFGGVKRRMEKIATIHNVTIYDDFAHHPTAIATTLAGLRNNVGEARIIAIIEPRSNTMKAGVHKEQLAQSAADADISIWLQPENLAWDLNASLQTKIVQNSDGKKPLIVCDDIQGILQFTLEHVQAGDHIVIMSNGGFGGIHRKLIHELEHHYA